MKSIQILSKAYFLDYSYEKHFNTSIYTFFYGYHIGNLLEIHKDKLAQSHNLNENNYHIKQNQEKLNKQ